MFVISDIDLECENGVCPNADSSEINGLSDEPDVQEIEFFDEVDVSIPKGANPDGKHTKSKRVTAVFYLDFCLSFNRSSSRGYQRVHRQARKLFAVWFNLELWVSDCFA